jgi:hypothetical protein
MRIIIGANQNGNIKIWEDYLGSIYGLTYLFSYNIVTHRCKDFNKIQSEEKKRILRSKLNSIKSLAAEGYNDYLTID